MFTPVLGTVSSTTYFQAFGGAGKREARIVTCPRESDGGPGTYPSGTALVASASRYLKAPLSEWYRILVSSSK